MAEKWPSDFERHTRGDGKRFHVRCNRQPGWWDWEVYGVGLDLVAVCPTQELAYMVAHSLERIADIDTPPQ